MSEEEMLNQLLEEGYSQEEALEMIREREEEEHFAFFCFQDLLEGFGDKEY